MVITKNAKKNISWWLKWLITPWIWDMWTKIYQTFLMHHFRVKATTHCMTHCQKWTCNFRYSCEVLISFEWCVQSLKWSKLQKLMILKLFWECNSICHYGFDQRAIACLMQHSFCVISKNFYLKFSNFKSPIIHSVWPPTPSPPPQFCINYCF